MIVDNNVIDAVPLGDLLMALMAAFIVSNICYPKGCTNLYSFLQATILRYRPQNAALSVKYLLAQINAHGH